MIINNIYNRAKTQKEKNFIYSELNNNYAKIINEENEFENEKNIW